MDYVELLRDEGSQRRWRSDEEKERASTERGICADCSRWTEVDVGVTGGV